VAFFFAFLERTNMDSSKFNLWRASFSFCFIDGFLSPEESNWIDEKIKLLPFTKEQKDTLIKDLKDSPKLNELLPLITKPADRGFLANNLRILAKLDNQLSIKEKEQIDLMIDTILKGINLNELKKIVQDDEIQSYHEDDAYQIHNKHSYSEKIIKNLMKTLNPSDYVDPN
jgi:hypothetical protein